jgi:DMSO/TMAO reductase YedYZ molybdopterin-dependent catalytic subunit
MEKSFHIMTDEPLNAETRAEDLSSWVTPNRKFFSRNQSKQIPEPIALDQWRLRIEGEVEREIELAFEELTAMPKETLANTMECSGNGRALLQHKAKGNRWTIGGVGNAVWGGVWLERLLRRAGLTERSQHVAFEGYDGVGKKEGTQFARSIPIEKAMSSTLLAYEMNGEPLPQEHGYPLRSLPLGWTGANCVKWLTKITVMDQPYEGFFMDRVYRVYYEGQQPHEGVPVTAMPLKSFVTRPRGETIEQSGPVSVLGVAYAGEAQIERVEVSVDGGARWHDAELIGPREPYAWRQWRFLWDPEQAGAYRILSRAWDSKGNAQPMEAEWNVLGYGNNGVFEHGAPVEVAPGAGKP